MVFEVRDLMEGAYPELRDSADRISKVVDAEERQFERVLRLGISKLDEAIQRAMRKALPADTGPTSVLGQVYESDYLDARHREPLEFAPTSSLYESYRRNRFAAPGPQAILEGEAAFSLYETFGLPEDLIREYCRDKDVAFDEEGFNRARAGGAGAGAGELEGREPEDGEPGVSRSAEDGVRGLQATDSPNCEVLAIVKDGVGVPAAKAGDLVEVVLDQTSFYGDSGGQAGDTGWFPRRMGIHGVAEIQGCVLPVQGVRAHKALLEADSRGRRSCAHGGGWRAARCDPAQSYGDASAARGAAAGAGNACEAGGVGGASGPAALRFFALCAGGRRGVAGD